MKDFKEIVESVNCSELYVESANFSITAGFSNAFVANITYQISTSIFKQFFELLEDLINDHQFELYSSYEPNLNEYGCTIRISNSNAGLVDAFTTNRFVYSSKGQPKVHYEPLPYVGVSIELQAFTGIVLHHGVVILTEFINELVSGTYVSNKQIKMNKLSEEEHDEQASRRRR